MSLRNNQSSEAPCAANQSQNNSLDDCWTSTDGNSEFKELLRNICLGVVLVAACLLTIVGNVLVLHAVRTERKLQTVRNVAPAQPLFVISGMFTS